MRSGSKGKGQLCCGLESGNGKDLFLQQPLGTVKPEMDEDTEKSASPPQRRAGISSENDGEQKCPLILPSFFLPRFLRHRTNMAVGGMKPCQRPEKGTLRVGQKRDTKQLCSQSCLRETTNCIHLILDYCSLTGSP